MASPDLAEKSLVLIPVLVLAWFGPAGAFGHDDLVHLEDRAGGRGGVLERPVLGEPEVEDAGLRRIQRRVRALALPTVCLFIVVCSWGEQTSKVTYLAP